MGGVHENYSSSKPGICHVLQSKYKSGLLFSEDRLTSFLIFKTIMATFTVHVTIENKPGISDPEGDTILNDLVLKGSHKNISKIKTAKMLKFTIKEKDKKTAGKKIQEACDELRIYNPMVSKVAIQVID